MAIDALRKDMWRMSEEIREFEQITKFIEQLTFKKKFIGGISVEDVYACMQELNAMYKDCVLDIKKESSVEIDELRAELEREKNKNQEYNEKSELLTKTITTVHKNSDVMLLQAEREANQIKAKAIKEVERIVEEKNEKVKLQQLQAQRILDELSTIKVQSVNNLNLIVNDLNHLASEIATLHDKMLEIPDTPQKIFSSEPASLKREKRYESDLA